MTIEASVLLGALVTDLMWCVSSAFVIFGGFLVIRSGLRIFRKFF